MTWMLIPVIALSPCVLVAQQPDKGKVVARAAWLGVYPELSGWDRTFRQPEVGKAGLTYRQTAQYEWSGGAARRLDVTLARDPAFKTRYDPKALQREAKPPKQVTVGQHTAWLWDVTGAGNKEDWPLQARLVVILGEDRILQLDARGPGPWAGGLEELAKRFNLAAVGPALDAAPRTDFRRTVEAFRQLKKGISYADVMAWVGSAERDIGSGIHIMEYTLDDGTLVRLGFPDFQKLIYVKHQPKPGTSVDLVK